LKVSSGPRLLPPALHSEAVRFIVPGFLSCAGYWAFDGRKNMYCPFTKLVPGDELTHEASDRLLDRPTVTVKPRLRAASGLLWAETCLLVSAPRSVAPHVTLALSCTSSLRLTCPLTCLSPVPPFHLPFRSKLSWRGTRAPAACLC
jgi:hypothetical protein